MSVVTSKKAYGFCGFRRFQDHPVKKVMETEMDEMFSRIIRRMGGNP
jgi:hypothetical protein